MKKNGPFIRPPRFSGGSKLLIGMKITCLTIMLPSLQASANLGHANAGADVKRLTHADALKAFKSFNATIKVSGKITDNNGEPLANVSISAAGGKGVVSNESGKYSIDVDDNASLTFTLVGYATQEIKVAKKSVINVTMQKSTANLSEVVVVGYGTQSKQKVTSAVTTLKTDQFKDAPYTDIQSAIAGRSAGVVVNFSGGEPGSVPSLTIRGGEPLIGQTAPLYVIDGIIRDQATFVNLNINDIENVSFLKDAAATAVYGSKSSAGIVLVKTKSGASGKPAVVYSNNLALNTPSYFPKLINAYDKALAANAIGESSGNGKYSAYSQGQLDTIKNNLNPAMYPNTDWYGLAFKKTAFQQSHNLSVSGGGNQTKYYVGLGYFGQGSNYVNNSFKVNRFSYNTKITSNFDDLGLSVAFALNGYYNYSTQPPSGSSSIFGHIVARSPFNAAFNKDGSLAGLVDHPLAEIYSPGYARAETFFNDANLAFTWNVPKVRGLSFRAMGDYSIASNPSKVFNVLATQYNADGTIYPTPKPSLSQTSSDTKAFNAEFQADYMRAFGLHNFGATFVSVVRGGNNKWFSAARTNFPSTAIDQMFAGDASTQTNNGSASEWGEVGYVGRLKYDYAGKYLLELNGRYDGSDYFPPSKRFGFFPSISGGWVISSEDFYRKAGLANVFSYFKFKASYGQVGSIGGTKYAYIPQYGVTSQAYVANGSLQNGYYEGGLTISNQNITWFKTASRDFGFEFDALNKKLSGNFDYFFTRTSNILGSPAFSYTEPLGQSLPQVLTDAATRKEGIDFALNYNWSANKDLKGYVGFNATYFNYLWERTNEDSATLTNPYTRQWGNNQNYYGTMYASNGVYQSYADIMNNPNRMTATALGLGDVWLQDTNGDGKIDAQDYRRMGLSQMPRFTFGLPVGVEYKGLHLDVLIQGTGSHDVYLGTYLQGGEGLTRINYEFQKDFWTSTNTSSSFPRAGTNAMNAGNNYTNSTYWLKDARFVRLKSLTLSYNFKRLVKSKIFSDLSAHISGTNLLTFSPVTKYFDPELADNNNFFYPVNRTYSAGIRVGF
jgi:TonB-linked SusC/RagA family outer membrane protein